MGNFKTIYGYGEAEIIINKSKFIGYAMPISTEEEAQEFIEKIKKKHKDATHNVPVYLLGEKFDVQRYSDDGEPSGTAGIPIIAMLKNEGITDLVLVVTRYFGGIKLGKGGLVRSYTNVAKDSLAKAKIIEIREYDLLSIEVDYGSYGKIENFLENNKIYFLKESVFLEKVEMKIYSKKEDIDLITNMAIEVTHNMAKIINLGTFPLKINGEKPVEV